MSKQNLIDVQQSLSSIEDELCSFLATLKAQAIHCQDVPQFERGATLPETITPTKLQLTAAQLLTACIKPQPVFKYKHNLPKRLAGLIHLTATQSEYDKAVKLVNDINQLREELIASVLEHEPNYRKRASLTRALFPDILYQTYTRKIPLLPYDTEKVSMSWCPQQGAVKRLPTEEARQLVEGFNANAPVWQAQKHLARLEDARNVYKISNVRVHPQANIKFASKDKDKYPSQMRKVHSPFIALTGPNTKIEFTPLNAFTESKDLAPILKQYKPLIEGTCLVYRE